MAQDSSRTAGSSLARNTLYSALSSAGNGLMVLLVIAAARVLGDDAFGQFSFALAIAIIFEMIIDIGLTALASRDVARDRTLAGVYLPNILGWKLILSACTMVLLALAINLMHQPPIVRSATYIMGGASVLRTFKSTSTGFFQAYERFDLILLTTYTERLGLVALGAVTLLFRPSLLAFSAVFLLVRIPDVALAYWLVDRHISPVRLKLDKKAIRQLQTAALPFGSYSFVAAIYAYIGTVVLSEMRPAHEVGWYSAGAKIYEGLMMFPFLLSMVLLPRLSLWFVENRNRHAKLSIGAMRLIVMAALPLAAVIGIMAPQALGILYGNRYLHAVPILRLLLAAAVLMFANSTANTVLISANHEKSALRIAATGLAVTCAANLFTVPRYGAIGSALSLLVSEACIFILLVGWVHRMVFPIPLRLIWWRPALAAAAGGAATYAVRGWGSLLSALVFLTSYAACLLILRTFTRQDWSTAKSILLPQPTTD